MKTLLLSLCLCASVVLFIGCMAPGETREEYNARWQAFANSMPQYQNPYLANPPYQSNYQTAAPYRPLNQRRRPIANLNANPYDPDSLANPYGAGSPYKADGLMNPYSQYGSKFSNKSWTNPYATQAPKLYDQNGNYKGKLSTNPYDADSTSNPYGRYGSQFSHDSINNPYGAGNPYSTDKIYVVPEP